MNLKELLEKQQAIVDAARSAGRELTAEEQSEFDSLQRQIDALTNQGAPAPAAPTPAPTPADNGGQRGAGNPAPAPAPTPADNGQRGADTTAATLAAERQRVREIEQICSYFGVDSRSFVDNGSTVDEVRAAVINAQMANHGPVHTGTPSGGVQVTADEGDKYRDAASDALLLRGGLTPDHIADGAQNLRGLSIKDMAIECMQRDGYTGSNLYHKGADEIYGMAVRGFYNPEASFPAILDQTIEKAYKQGFRTVPVTFDRFTKKGTLSDFKTHDNYYIAGPVGEFLEVPENGELKHDVFKDDKLPTRKLKTYGRQFTLSRKAFIDDDIGLVTSLPARYAASARKTINNQVYKILVNNPVIFDGAQLFSAAHKNLLGTGTGITQEAMQTMIMALATQEDQFGQPVIITPKTLVVPAGMKFDMYTLFYSPTINTSDNTQAVNPLYAYRDSIEVVEDPTINALCGGMGKTMPWFLFGDSNETDGIEVDYLNGQEIPNIRRMETPGQLGFIWDIYLDWGISVMEYRGIVKNPGTTVDLKIALATE